MLQQSVIVHCMYAGYTITYRSTGPLICHLKYSDDADGADAVTT